MINFRAQAMSYLNAAVIVLGVAAGIYGESERAAATAGAAPGHPISHAAH